MKHIEINCNSLAECYARLRESDLIYVSDLGHKAFVAIDIDTDSPFDGSYIHIPDYTKSKGGLTMTDQEIDKWVEEHLVRPKPSEHLLDRLVDSEIVADVVLKWGKLVAKKFYKLGLQDGNNKESLQTRQQEAD